MAIPTLHLPLSGSLKEINRGGESVFTTDGPTRYVPSPFNVNDSGYLQGDAINYVSNPILANDIVGFGTGNVNVTLSRVTGMGITTPYPIDTAVRATYSVTGGSNTILISAHSSLPKALGTMITTSVLVRPIGSAVGKSITMLIYESGGASVAETTAFVGKVVAANSGFELFARTGPLKKADRTAVSIYLQVAGAVAGDIIEATAFSIEQSSYATPRVVGSFGSGFSWQGTPHASPSIYASASNRALYSEEATTNACLYPFPISLAGWVQTGGATEIYENGWLKWIRPANGGIAINTNTGSSSPPASVGQVWTVSAVTRRQVVGAYDLNFRLIWYDTAGGLGIALRTDLSANIPITSASDGERYAWTFPAAPTGALSFRFALLSSSGTLAINDEYWMKEIQFELKAYATTFCHGSMGTGYSWTGAPHSSTSNRVLPRVRTILPASNYVDTLKGSLIVRFRRENLAAISGTPRIVDIGSYNSAGDHIAITYNSIGSISGSFTSGLNSGVSVTPIPTVLAHTAGEWHWAYLEWTPTTAKLITDKGTATASRNTPIGSISSDQQMFIGSASSVQSNNGYISDLLVFDRPLTSNELNILTSIQAPWKWNDAFSRIGDVIVAVTDASPNILRVEAT